MPKETLTVLLAEALRGYFGTETFWLIERLASLPLTHIALPRHFMLAGSHASTAVSCNHAKLLKEVVDHLPRVEILRALEGYRTGGIPDYKRRTS